jgi:hypothetical protein
MLFMAKSLRLIIPLILAVTVQASKAQVVINEYSCSNRNIISDNYGDYEDYIELYNNGSSSVDLNGWYLSDDTADPTKYQIPSSITLAPGAFKIIWASSRNKVVSGNVHTNFKLTQTKGDQIVLSDPTGQIADSLTLQLTQKNHSRGRTTNGDSVWGVFTQPSPGASNGASYSGYTARPVADVQQGFYTTAQTITLSVPDPNATIYYTTDGSTPTLSSTLYTSPLTVSSTTLLRARAFSSQSDLLPSFEEVNTYFMNVTHDERYYILSLASGDFDELFNGWGNFDIDAYLEFFDKQRNLAQEGEGKVDPHGNDSWAFPQKGIDFEIEDDYGYAHDIPLKIFEDRDRDNFDHLILKAGASDNYPFSWGSGPCHMRDAYVHTLALRHDVNVDVRTYEPGIIYINGEYWGLYEVREKMDEPDFTNHYYNQGEEDIDVLKYWGWLVIAYGSDTAWNNLYSFMQTNSMTDPDSYQHVKDRLDFSSMIDNMVMNTYMVNCDWINWNTMWWRGRNPDGQRTKWTYSFWDEDNVLGLGQNYSGWPTTNYTADPCDLAPLYQNTGPAMGHLEMLDRLLVNDEFKNLYVNRYADLMNTVLDCDTMTAMMDEFVDLLTPEMPAQIARWGGTMTGWENNLTYLQDFITQRCTYIDSALVDCYEVTGPYDITVLVDPPGAGEVHVNSLLPQTYPWTGTYFGEVDLGFKAVAFPGNNMQFASWEVSNNVINPNPSSDTMSLNLQSDDVIIAHFENVLPSFALTFDVMPAGAGTLTIEGSTPSVYPYSASYLSGDEINIKANPAGGYVFDYWDLSNHFVNPNSTEPDAYFTLFTGDAVVAHFRQSVGINEPNITSLQLYPSLTHDQFHLSYELTAEADLSVKLFSLSGNMLMNLTGDDAGLKQQGKHERTVSMKDTGLPPGIYFLDFAYPGFNKTFKIVLLPH